MAGLATSLTSTSAMGCAFSRITAATLCRNSARRHSGVRAQACGGARWGCERWGSVVGPPNRRVAVGSAQESAPAAAAVGNRQLAARAAGKAQHPPSGRAWRWQTPRPPRPWCRLRAGAGWRACESRRGLASPRAAPPCAAGGGKPRKVRPHGARLQGAQPRALPAERGWEGRGRATSAGAHNPVGQLRGRPAPALTLDLIGLGIACRGVADAHGLATAALAPLALAKPLVCAAAGALALLVEAHGSLQQPTRLQAARAHVRGNGVNLPSGCLMKRRRLARCSCKPGGASCMRPLSAPRTRMLSSLVRAVENSSLSSASWECGRRRERRAAVAAARAGWHCQLREALAAQSGNVIATPW